MTKYLIKKSKTGAWQAEVYKYNKVVEHVGANTKKELFRYLLSLK